MKFKGLQYYQEFRDLCQQDVVSLSCRPAALDSYLLACLHVINEKTVLPRKHRVKPPGLSWFQKNQLVLYFFTNKEHLSSLLNQTFVSSYYLPDTTEQNHPQHGRSHSVVEKADLNQTTAQINNYEGKPHGTVTARNREHNLIGRSGRASERWDIRAKI